MRRQPTPQPGASSRAMGRPRRRSRAWRWRRAARAPRGRLRPTSASSRTAPSRAPSTISPSPTSTVGRSNWRPFGARRCSWCRSSPCAPTSVPLDTGNLLQVEHSLVADGSAPKVQLVELSVDPARDTPARLAAYANLTGATWELLTETPAQAAAGRALLRVGRPTRPRGLPARHRLVDGKAAHLRHQPLRRVRGHRQPPAPSGSRPGPPPTSTAR